MLIIPLTNSFPTELFNSLRLKVFCYVSRKMAGEGSEKTWDQCRVKLKNLKSQWRYVKDRIPGIETADLDDEDVVRQLSQECQTRGGKARGERLPEI